jgi:hypothetical protein
MFLISKAAADPNYMMLYSTDGFLALLKKYYRWK